MTGGGTGPKQRTGFKVVWASWVGVLAILMVGAVVTSMWDEGLSTGDEVRTAPFFGPQDVGRLVEQLSGAAAAQGVCYGWVIDSGRPYEIKSVPPSYPGTFSPHAPPAPPSPGPGETQAAPSGPSPAPVPAPTETGSAERLAPEQEYDLRRLDGKGVEYGSNLGVGIDPRQRPDRCANWMVLESKYNFSTQHDQWTFGSFEIKTSSDELAVAVIGYDGRMGQGGDDGIDGEDGAARLRDAIGGMPMLTAEKGLAPPVPAAAEPVVHRAANDVLSEPGYRNRVARNVIGGLLIGAAVVVVVVAVVRNRRGSTS